jgi:hypothetical protein
MRDVENQKTNFQITHENSETFQNGSSLRKKQYYHDKIKQKSQTSGGPQFWRDARTSSYTQQHATGICFLVLRRKLVHVRYMSSEVEPCVVWALSFMHKAWVTKVLQKKAACRVLPGSQPPEKTVQQHLF